LFFVIEPSQAKILATLPGVNGVAFPQTNAIGAVTTALSRFSNFKRTKHIRAQVA
jgi:hypothetical protein